MTNKKKKTKKRSLDIKAHVMDLCLACIGIFLILFTITIIYIFKDTGSEPSSLIASVFTACTGELGFMALIKNSKNKYGIKDEQENDDTNA